MATDNQMEEPRSRKPRHRRNFQMEELPTFTKWLTPFSPSSLPSSTDSNSKSNRYRPFKNTPIVLLDSSHQSAPVLAHLSNNHILPPISAPPGYCCWRTSKSLQLKFHLSLRKTKVVANASREEIVVAPGDVLDTDGCGCRCLPTCGRRKNMAVATSDLPKEEVAVNDVPNMRNEEVANSGPDLVKEGEAIVALDMRREGSGCCGQWECLPAFQICRRRKVVADKEEVIVVVPKVEEVANDNVNMKGESGGCLQTFHICAERKRLDDNSKTVEKEAAASNDSSNVGVSDLHKEWSGCSCCRCVPTFQVCGRRRRNVDSDVPNPDREEKVVVGVSNLPEQGVVAADGERHSKSAQGGNCWPFRICCARGWLPRFFRCGEQTAVDASNHQEENEKPPPDVRKEEEVAIVIPDSRKENIAVADGIPCHCKEKQMVAEDNAVLSSEEKGSAGDSIDLQKEENMSSGSIQDLGKEEEIEDSGVSNLGEEEGGCWCFKFGGKEGGRHHRQRSTRPRKGRRRWWLPTLGRKKVCVSIPNSHEEEGLVDNGVSDLRNEVVDAAGATGVVADTDHSKCTRGCWHSKPRRRRSVGVDKEEGNGRRSNSKRRRGWLQRWGRKQREGRESKR